MGHYLNQVLPEVRSAGRKAFRDGKTLADCPEYEGNTFNRSLNRRNWIHGFVEAEHKVWVANFKKNAPGVKLPRTLARYPAVMASL